jgi:carboxyl-terminal processing protease
MFGFSLSPVVRRLSYALCLASLLFALELQALESNKELETIARLSSTIIAKRHYTQRPMDDKLSSELFDEYFKTLDPNKMFFTAKDIEKFSDRRTKLDEQLAAGNLSFAFDVFNLYLSRLEAYETASREFIDKGFDFSSNEDFEFNRSKADWLPNEDALKELWRRKVKNDVLSLMIVDKATKEGERSKKVSERNAHPSWASAVSPEERVKRRISQFVQIYKKFDPIDVLEIYLRSLARVYDPHSDYMTPRTEEDFNIQMKLSLVGIGALLSSEGGYTKIEKVIPGGPAEAEGSLAAGDRIIAVAQEGAEPVDIMDMPLSKVVSLIRGKKGTKVILTVLDGSKGISAIPKQIVITRDTVALTESEAKGVVRDIKGPNGKMLKIGVITLPSFYMDFEAAYKGEADYKSSTRDVAKFLAQFKKDGVDGVIIDLRSNGGGSLLEAVTLTGLFIKSGPVVQVRGVDGTEVKYDEDNGQVAYDGPLAVMVNRLSASAAEIFAAAIKDYNRGVLIGDSKTHGKGTVQTVLELKNFLAFIGAKFPAGSVKFTNAKFYRINGSSTQLKGVTPDITFPSFTDSMEIGEEKLDHALPWDSIPATSYAPVSEVLPSVIPTLRDRSAKRIAASKDFQSLMMDIEANNKIKDRKAVSLNFDTRWQEYLNEKKIQDEQVKLMRLAEDNDQDSVKTDDSKKKEEKDLYLDEALNIISDLSVIQQKLAAKAAVAGQAQPPQAPVPAPAAATPRR